MTDQTDLGQEQESPAEDAQDTVDEPMGPEEGKTLSQLNILPLLLKEAGDWVEKETKTAARLVKADIEARAEFMKRRASQLKLFVGAIDTLGFPAEGAKAPHIAIMCKALLHLWARIFDQVIPAKGDICHAATFGPGQEDIDRAQRVEQHLNWQLRYRMPDWSSGHQVSILAWNLSGSTFRHYRWDPHDKVHRFDSCPITDIIIPYTEQDIHPLMPKVPRITRVLRLTRWEAEAYVEQGMWTNLDKVFPEEDDVGSSSDTDQLPPPPSQEEENEVEKAVIEIEGVDKPEKVDRSTKQEYYEQQTWLKFPKNLSAPALKPLAGKTKPVIFTFHKRTKQPLAISIREEPDPIDQARFDQETQAFTIASQNAAMAGTSVPPGVKPPRPVRMKTMHNIIHYRLFPNPEGFYGLGVGYLLEGSNELANALAAEYLLGAKFENIKGGWMAKGTRAKRGDVQIEYGKWIETELEPEQLRNALQPHQFGPPSEGLMKVVEKLEANSEIVANADILSGEKGASNETAKGMMVRNSNAMALISVMTRLYLEPLKYEIKMLAHGNAIQMDGPETFPVASLAGPDQQQVKQVTVRPEDYVEDIHVEFTADARMSSKPERISDAQSFIQLILNSPLAQNQMLVDFSFRKLFRAAESPEYEAAMGPPPTPPPPPQPQSQDTENAGFFNEQDHPVLEDDNHMEHLHKINELKQSPLIQHMSSTGKQMMDRHERGHISKLYLQLQELQKVTGLNVHGMASAGGAAGGPGPGALPPEAGGAPGGGGEAPPSPGPNGRPGGGAIPGGPM